MPRSWEEQDREYQEQRRAERDNFRGLLGSCANEGCFGSNPGIFETMLYMDDSGVRTHLNRVAVAAREAGEQGVPLEDATYSEVSYDVVDTWVTFGGEGNTISLGEGEEVRIGDLDETSWGAQVARCAYSCTQARSCPLSQLRQEAA